MNVNELPICPLCGAPITESDYITQCPDCRVMYHEECWDANEGCSTPECSQNHAEEEEYRRQSLNWAMPANAPAPVNDDFPPLDNDLYPQEENDYNNIEQLQYNENVYHNENEYNGEGGNLDNNIEPPQYEDNLYNNEGFSGEVGNSADDIYEQANDLTNVEDDLGLDLNLDMDLNLDLAQLHKEDDNSVNENAPPKEHAAPNAIPQGGYFSNDTVHAEHDVNADVAPIKYSSDPPQTMLGSLLRMTQRGNKAPMSILRYPSERGFAAPPRQPSVTRLKSSLVREGADSKYLADVLDDIKDLHIPLHSTPDVQMPLPQNSPVQGGERPVPQMVGRSRAAELPKVVHKDPEGTRASRPMQIRGTPVPRAEPKPILTLKQAIAAAVAVVAAIVVILLVVIPPAPKDVSFRKDSFVLTINESVSLDYVIEPQRAEKRGVKWESTNKNIAVVDDGVVRGISEGSCDIKMSVGKKTAVEHVNVVPQVEVILLESDEVELVLGETMRVSYEVVPTRAAGAETEILTSDPATVQVDGDDLKAVGQGECIITIIIGKKRANMLVRVVPMVTSFIIDERSMSIVTGEREQIKYTITPNDAQERMPEFTSSNRDVAIVEDGVIIGIGSGNCEITGNIDGLTQRISVTVKNSVKGLSLTPQTISLYKGETAQINAEMTPPGDYKINWSSSNESVASVDSKGKVTAVGEGTVRITARVDDIRETVDVNVFSEKSKTAAKKIVGTWSGRYAYDTANSKVKALAGYETVLIAYANGECSLVLSGSRLSGVWMYMEDDYYMFTLGGGAKAIGQIEDISDVKNGLLVVFDDIDGSKMDTSIVYQKTG